MEWLKKRLVERSTWLGITTLLSLCGYSIAPEYQDDIMKGAIALMSMIFVSTSDKKRVEVVENVNGSIQAPAQSFNTTTDGRDAAVIDGQ